MVRPDTRIGIVIPSWAMSLDDLLPTDLASAHALIIAQRQALSAAELRATAAESEAQYRALLIEKLKFTIRKLRHDRFGQSSERGTLLDQLELQLADLEADAAQAETARQIAAGSDCRDDDRGVVRTAAAGQPSAARAFATRADRLFGAWGLPVLRRDLLRKIGEDVTRRWRSFHGNGR